MDVLSILSAILVFIISILILVSFHEYGHFIVARINKVKVLEFAIGFGKTLLKYKGKEGTLYQVKLFPFGGYIKMLDSRDNEVEAKDKQNDFNLKHPLQKISIVIAGPLLNFILAIFCFFIMYQNGVLEYEPINLDSQNKIVISSVINEEYIKNNILRTGDVIIGIKNKKYNMSEILDYIENNPNTKVDLQVQRDNIIHEINIQIGNKDNNGYLGILFEIPYKSRLKKYDVIDSFNQSLIDTYNYIEKSFTMIFKIVFGKLGVNNVHGPLMVAKVANKSWDLGLAQFLKFLGIISIGLGVINLLPIPLLDGGHVVYHIIEWINPKWITKAMEEAWLKLGISFIILIFFLAIYNDIKYW